MTEEQRKAHQRMLATLPSMKILADEELDEPKNWKTYNRDLTPSEMHHAEVYGVELERRHNDKREVVIEGVRYPTLLDAAKALKCSRTKIYYMLGEKSRFARATA